MRLKKHSRMLFLLGLAYMSLAGEGAYAAEKVYWDKFAFCGDLRRSRSTGDVVGENEVSSLGVSYAENRYGFSSSSLAVSANSSITIPDMNAFFSGSYVLNGGYDLDDTHYYTMSESSGVVQKGREYYVRTEKYYFPTPAAPSSSSETAASYLLWFRLDQVPTTTATILSRKQARYKAECLGRYACKPTAVRNMLLEVKIMGANEEKAGKLAFTYASGSAIGLDYSVSTDVSSRTVSVGDWHCLVLTSTGDSSFVAYLDGFSLGSYSQNVTLGYLPTKFDNRCLVIGGGDVNLKGGLEDNPVTLTLGGFKGVIDDFVIYHSALTAKEVQAIYKTDFDVNNVRPSINLAFRRVKTAKDCKLLLDGDEVASTTNEITTLLWQPQKLGLHTFTYSTGDETVTTKVSVKDLPYATAPQPNPPSPVDSNISLQQSSRSFSSSGGTGSITVTGVDGYSGTYTVSTSSSWLTINTPEVNRKAGRPLVYAVAANNGAEDRIGYIYVGGHVHTVTQTGDGVDLECDTETFETDGGEGSVLVNVESGIKWCARPNVDWISVAKMNGTGSGELRFTVAPWNKVSTRVGTITVGGRTLTITQYGRRILLPVENSAVDYKSHAVNVEVLALADTEWDVELQATWLSVVGEVTGRGSANVSLGVSENPSYLARSGVVRIGTETYVVSQSGRAKQALQLTIGPGQTTASSKGANGLIMVSATPDLPWRATSDANWITVMSAYQNGAGNGNVIYSASPNSTLADRRGTVTITPDSATGLKPCVHTVLQAAATAQISTDGHVFDSAGGAFQIEVAVAENVNWTIESLPSWITIEGDKSRYGPGKVTLAAKMNQAVEYRETDIVIAGYRVHVAQQGREFEVEYTSKVFDAQGGDGSVEVHPNGSVSWTAVSSDPSWIAVWGDDNCTYDSEGNVVGIGDGTVYFYVDSYGWDGTTHSGWIQIGDKKVFITQRPYDLSIEPNGASVSGNAGEGEIGVPAPIGEVWNAIATEPWITIVSGYDEGTGSGTVRYTYTDNMTGLPRAGKIVIAGEEYTLTQAARKSVSINVQIENNGGLVTGIGSYGQGENVELKAIPNDGFEFDGWQFADGTDSSDNPLHVIADVDKVIIAMFKRIPVCVVNGETVRKGSVRAFEAPEERVEGGQKLVCKGTSAFSEKGASFQLKITEDVSFEWDLWETNYLLTVESPEHGRIMEGDTVAVTHWVARGETVTLNAIADGGYTFFRWTGGAEASGEAATGVVRMDSAKTVGAVFGVFDDTIASAADAPGLTFVTGGDAEWHPVVDASVSTGYTSVRSGAIGKESETWLETTVYGAGTLSFDWRVDCEKDDGGAATWDRLTVFANGVEVARIDGKTDWRQVSLPLSGKSIIRWSFYRDDFDESKPGCRHCGWIDNVRFKE